MCAQDRKRTSPKPRKSRQDSTKVGRTHEELEQLATQLFWLHDLMVQISVAPDVRSARRVACQCTARILEEDWGGLVCWDRDGLRPLAFEGETVKPLGKSLREPCDSVRRLFDTDSEAIVARDAGVLKDLFSVWPHAASSRLLVAPVRCSQHPPCLLVAGTHGDSLYPEVNLMLLNAIAASVAVALDKAILYERVQRLAVTDGLTHTANYRLFRETLSDLVDKGMPDKVPFTLLLVDVDRFKTYNDTFGHLAGDKALVRVARLMKSLLNKSDILARWGGDEFGILLPGQEILEAMALADRLTQSVACSMFRGGRHVPESHLTISVGAASFPKHAQTPDELIQKADQALYAAKWAGRNVAMQWESTKLPKSNG